MNYSIWQLVVVTLGLGLALLSLLCVIYPQELISRIQVVPRPIQYMDIVIRIVLGISLIFSSSTSKYPLAFQIVGYASIIAAAIIMGSGEKRISKFIGFMANRVSKNTVRFVSLVGVLFGCFLVYGVA